MSTQSIDFDCPHCQACQSLHLTQSQDELSFLCGYCGKAIDLKHVSQTILETCPVCGSNTLYQHKDFNKAVGIAIFLIGAVLSFWTYTLSLIAALLVDACLYPFSPWMQVCYRCKSEFRGWQKNSALDRFNHEIAAHFEYAKKT